MVLYHWWTVENFSKWEMIKLPKSTYLNVKLVRVDCEYIQGKEKETLGYNPNVMGYPTIRVHKKNSNMANDYEGPREVDDIVSYLTKNFSEVDKNQSKLKKKKSTKSNKGKKKKSGKGKKKSRKVKKKSDKSKLN